LEGEPTVQGRCCSLSASRQTIAPAWGAGRMRTDDGGAELVRLAIRQVERGHLLQMVVQQPGVVEQALQDQGLATGHGAALAAHDRARCQLRTRRLVGAAGEGGDWAGRAAGARVESAGTGASARGKAAR